MSEAEIRSFLIADVRGYTSFTQSHGDEAAARLAVGFAEIAREGVEAHGGAVLELRGDEAMAVFSSAREALRAAVDLQQAFADEFRYDPALPLRVGIGLDAGEAVRVEQGYRGGALNLAARLCSKAAAGEVLASQGIAHLARSTEGLDFHDGGMFDMKGMEQPVAVVRVVPAGMDPDQLIARFGAAPDATAPSRSEVAPALDPIVPIVGRDADVRRLRWAWRQARRGRGCVLAVAGPTGIGKTRLAGAAAALPARDGATIVYVACADTDDAPAAEAIEQALSGDAPGLLVIDDAHEAGPATLAALAEAGAAAAGRPLMVVITFQEPAPDTLLGVVDRLVGDAGLIRPGPLSLADVREIAALYLGEAARGLPTSALEETGGVPRKVHEFVGDWARTEASRRLGEAASRAALGRSDLRSIEADVAGSAVDLQRVQERVRLYSADSAGRVGRGHDGVPFKGLAAFEAADANWFFGRERLVAELIARLAGGGLLGVVGPSGSGKSSAVRAGLVPALAAGALPGSERWTVVGMRPGAHPLRELDRAVWAALPAGMRDRLTGSDLPLRAARGAQADGERILIVVDQFEEVFTACADEAERAAFVAALTEAAADPGGRQAVVLALRADFYGRCAAHPMLAAQLGSNHVLVGPMTAEEYRRVIEQPAIAAGVRVEPALADALVADVADQAGALPLLSTALLELWEKRDGRTMRTQAYMETGGVRGAVARLAEDVFGALSETQQASARSIMLRLAGPGEGDAVVRRRVALAEFDSVQNPDVAAVLAAFTERRLLTASDGSIEVSHEALLREWPRLQGWLDDDRAGRQLRAHLIAAAREWDTAGREPAELYRGTRLESALDWTAGHTLELNDLEREFLGTSRAAAEAEADRQRRANRRLRALLAAGTVLLVVAAVAGVFAVIQRDNARTAATRALAQRLGAQGVTQPQLSRALLLSREGWNLWPSEQTDGTLLSTLLRAPGVTRTFTTPESERPLTLAVLGDGSSVLGLGMNSNAVHFYDVASGAPLASLSGAGLQFSDCCAAAPGGDAVVMQQPSGKPVDLEVFDPHTGRIVGTLERDPHTSNPNAYLLGMFDAGRGDSTLLVAYFPDGTKPVIRVDRWDLVSRQMTGHTQITGNVDVSGVGMSNGGTRLDMITEHGELEIDAGTLRIVKHIPFTGAGPFGATNADATEAMFSSPDNSGPLSFVDLRTGTVTPAYGGPVSAVQSVGFSPTDPNLAITSYDNGDVVRWDARSHSAVQVLDLHASRVPAVGFSADGSMLFTASLDGTAAESRLSGAGGFGLALDVQAPGTDVSGSGLVGPTGVPLVATGAHRSFFQSSLTTVTAVDNRTGARVRFSATPAGSVLASIALSPSGRTLAVAAVPSSPGKPGMIELFDVSGRPRGIHSIHLTPATSNVTQLVYSQDGRLLYAVTGRYEPNTFKPVGDGYLLAWNARTDTPAFTPRRYPGTYLAYLAVNASGRLAALGTIKPGSPPVLVVRLPGGQRVGTFRDAPQGLQGVAFAPDGTLLVGAWSGQVQRVDPSTMAAVGQPVLTGGGPIASIQPVPGSSLFATTNFDGTAKLWDQSTGQEIGSSFTPLASLWTGASVSPDGRSMAILNQRGLAYIFPLSPDVWANLACHAAARNLTPTEWSQFVGTRTYTAVCKEYPLAAG